MAEQKYYPEAGSKEDSDELTPEMILTDNEQVEKPSVIYLGHDEDLSEMIHFDELPKSWQEHILQRQEGGYLPKDKMTFTKDEILQATSDEKSFTSSAVIDKLFDRINKDKVDFDLLPKVWQEKLESINKFGNITVDYLKKKGATDADIAKIKSGAYRQTNDSQKINQIRQELSESEIKKLDDEPRERLLKAEGLKKENNGIPKAAQTLNIGGLWQSVKSGWGRLFGKK